VNKFLLSLILPIAMAGTCWSQGYVTFANSVAFTTVADRLVRGLDGTGLVGSDLSQPPTYVAQLYYGANAGSLQPHTAAPARFRPGTTGPGLWLGGTRTLTGFARGTTLTLEVRGWDMRTGATYETAGIRGMSGTFTYTTPIDPLSPPTFYFMEGFRGFTIPIIPEPAPLLLLGVAVPALWFVVRRKCGTKC
jgi:hypothetical protein